MFWDERVRTCHGAYLPDRRQPYRSWCSPFILWALGIALRLGDRPLYLLCPRLLMVGILAPPLGLAVLLRNTAWWWWWEVMASYTFVGAAQNWQVFLLPSILKREI